MNYKLNKTKKNDEKVFLLNTFMIKAIIFKSFLYNC